MKEDDARRKPIFAEGLSLGILRKYLVKSECMMSARNKKRRAPGPEKIILFADMYNSNSTYDERPVSFSNFQPQ